MKRLLLAFGRGEADCVIGDCHACRIRRRAPEQESGATKGWVPFGCESHGTYGPISTSSALIPVHSVDASQCVEAGFAMCHRHLRQLSACASVEGSV